MNKGGDEINLCVSNFSEYFTSIIHIIPNNLHSSLQIYYNLDVYY